MQITLTITDDGVQVAGAQPGQVALSSESPAPLPTRLPESWWVEARTVFNNMQAAMARDDDMVQLATENWIKGMLKAAVLIMPDLDHNELMSEIMVTAPQPGENFEGIGKVVRHAPLPTEIQSEEELRAEPVIRTVEPTHVDLTNQSLDVLGPSPEEADDAEDWHLLLAEAASSIEDTTSVQTDYTVEPL